MSTPYRNPVRAILLAASAIGGLGAWLPLQRESRGYQRSKMTGTPSPEKQRQYNDERIAQAAERRERKADLRVINIAKSELNNPCVKLLPL